MNRLHLAYIWLKRCCHSRGFGIQSPTDYSFVRYVINEHWPYYAYDQLAIEDNWLRQKVGRLCLRLANHRQPSEIIDLVGFADYLQAGCRKAHIVAVPHSAIQLAVVPADTDYQTLFSQCDEQSIVLFDDIRAHYAQWNTIIHDPRASVTFDLYYCGIVLFDPKRTKQHYIINF